MRIGVVVIGAALLAGVTACGGSPPASGAADPLAGLTAKKVAAKAQADMRAKPAMRFTGTISGSGTTVTMSLVVEENAGCEGTFSQPGRGSFEFLDLHGQVWIKPDDAFWKSNTLLPSRLLRLWEGKWVTTTGTYAQYNGWAKTCTLNDKATGTTRGLRRLGTANISGHRTLILENPDKSKVYVTDTASPVIVRVAGPATGDGYITISLLPSAPAITAPPAKLIIHGS
jgi:hypothetical protein